jgi:NAD(P)-dependent dehydrogenase (short-subunit alcohol dehydrogenase family)
MFSTMDFLNPLYILGVVPALLLIYYLIRVFLINGTTCPSKARIDGKTVVITGGNTGIGKETARELAARGGRVIMGCRDTVKSAAAVEEIKRTTKNEQVFFKKLDLASTDSIRNFADEILREETRLDVLILNAGVMFTPYMLTKDGFEFQFGVNHLGHFLLTHLLLDRLKENAPSRVVVVSSLAHTLGSLDFKDIMWGKR